jgi:hypothetical protein
MTLLRLASSIKKHMTSAAVIPLMMAAHARALMGSSFVKFSASPITVATARSMVNFTGLHAGLAPNVPECDRGKRVNQVRTATTDRQSATKRRSKMVKKVSVATRDAERFDKPIFFNHLVTGVTRDPRNPQARSEETGQKLPSARRNRQRQQTDHSNCEPEID